MWGAEARAGNRPLFPEAHWGTGAEVHWEKEQARGLGRASSCDHRGKDSGGMGASTAFSSGLAGKVSPALVLVLAEVKERTAARAQSASILF